MSLIEDCAGLAGAEPQTWGTDLMSNMVFVGLDVHKATIAVAVAEGARGGEIRELGNFLNHPDHIKKLVERLAKGGRSLSFCCEAGPCGYGLYRQLIASGAGAQGGSTPPVLNRLRVALEPDWHPELPQGLDACRDLARCVLDEVFRFRSHRRRKEQPAAGVDAV